MSLDIVFVVLTLGLLVCLFVALPRAERFTGRQFAFEIASGITTGVSIMINLVRRLHHASVERIARGAQRTR